MALGFNAMGGVGCISVTANVAPRLCADFQAAMREGRWDEALALQDRLLPAPRRDVRRRLAGPGQICAVESPPGFPTELRLPLTEPSRGREGGGRRRARSRGIGVNVRLALSGRGL